MTRADTVIGAGLVVVFLILVRASTELTYQSEFAPGPGFAPFWVGVVGAALSAFVAFRGLSARPATAFDRSGALRVVGTIVGLVLALVLADTIGFVIVMTIYLLFVTLAVERLRPIPAVGTSLGTMLLIYLVFERFLNVPLPKGPLGI